MTDDGKDTREHLLESEGMDPFEERLRALFSTADLQDEPSAGLRRRIDDLAARRRTISSPRQNRFRRSDEMFRWLASHRRWLRFRPGMALGAGAVLAAGFMVLSPRFSTSPPGLPVTRPDRPASFRAKPGGETSPSRFSSLPAVIRPGTRDAIRAGDGSDRIARSSGRGEHNPPGPRRLRTDHAPTRRTASSPAILDDMAYVNLSSRARPDASGEPGKIAERPDVDDFVTIPLPRIAASPMAGDRAVAAAARAYEAEKAVVDERLFRKIDMGMKAGDLRELAERLTKQTGVRFYVAKDLEDWKLTVLVRQAPVRDLMRQVVRLFDLQWRRAGEEGKYRYSLVQTLRQRLADEEKRRRDDDEAILDVVEKLDEYRDVLRREPAEIAALAEEAKQQAIVAGSVEERARLEERQRILHTLSGPSARDGFTLFARLSPGEIVRLRNGEKVTFVYDGTPEGLAEDVAERVRKNYAGLPPQQIDGMWLSEVPLDRCHVTGDLSLNRDWPGRTVMNIDMTVAVRKGSQLVLGIRIPTFQSSGTPARLRDPGNARLHAAAAKDPRYAARVAFDPRPANPLSAGDSPILKRELWLLGSSQALQDRLTPSSGPRTASKPEDWIDSADMLEELHKETGRNVVADYYLRVYPRNRFTMNGRLSEVLNDLSDLLQSEWREDAGFLRIRRLNSYSEREMDVPNRLLREWSASLKNAGTLSLDQYVAVSKAPKPLLGSEEYRWAALIKWGIAGWSIPERIGWLLPFYETLSLRQKTAAGSDDGLPYPMLTPEQRAMKPLGFAPDEGEDPDRSNNRIYIRAFRNDSFVWTPLGMDGTSDRLIFPGQEPVRAKSQEEAAKAIEAYRKDHGIATDFGRQYPHEPSFGVWVGCRMGGKYRMLSYWAGDI